jgi:putative hemolysin
MDDGTIPHTKNHFSKRWKHFWSGGLKNSEDVTEEEIISMVKEGHEQGVLLASEAEMIHNIFEFGDKEAKDIMTHRQNVIALDGNMSYTDMVSFLAESGKSRYPVYLEDIDHIIGVLHIKDAFAFSQRNELFRTSIKDIPKLLREVEFIPETMKINTLFTRMQSEKSHLVIVVDEYGQTSGIVAMEDILEEIVGNIEDEHDEEEELIRQESDGSICMDGMTDFVDVVEHLELPLEKDAFETLNGFLISLLDKIPNDGETAKLHAYGYTFEILKVKDQIISLVRVTKDSNGVL